METPGPEEEEVIEIESSVEEKGITSVMPKAFRGSE
jgi:hypothetical protein